MGSASDPADSQAVVSYVAGRWAPRGKRMGHAGANVESGKATAHAKIEELRTAGSVIAEQVTQVGTLVSHALAA